MSNVTFTITATMPEDWADRFCSFLKRMEYDGKIGQSEAMGFYIDGDGDFRPTFEIDHLFKPVEPRSSEYIQRTPVYSNVLEIYDRR